MSKITVIGSFVVDMVAKMKKFPQAGETVLGESLEYFLGGKGINQCISVARLGGDAEMIGMLGKDENGEKFRKLMAEEGIKAESVFSCEYPTAAAQVQLNGNGQNRICVISSANFRFGMNEVEKIDAKLSSVVNGTTIAHFNGWTMLGSEISSGQWLEYYSDNDLYIYSDWDVVEFTATVSNGYSGDYSTCAFNYCDGLNLLDPVRSGYRFKGWKDNNTNAIIFMSCIKQVHRVHGFGQRAIPGLTMKYIMK